MLCSVELQRRLDFLGHGIGVGALRKRVEKHAFFNGAVHPLQDGAQGLGKLAVVITLLPQIAVVQAVQEYRSRGLLWLPLTVKVPYRTFAAIDIKQRAVFDEQAKTVCHFPAATGIVHQQQRMVVAKIRWRAKFFAKISGFFFGRADGTPMTEANKFGGEVGKGVGHGFLVRQNRERWTHLV